MIVFTETKFVLTQTFEDIHASIKAHSPCQPFEIIYSDLEKIVQSSDIKVVLEGITILETSVATGPLAPFEYSLATLIIKKCMVTAFPDTR